MTSGPYAVLRLGKIKGWGSVTAMGEHHTRARPTPNADPTKPPFTLVGSGNPETDVRTLIERLEIVPRSNGVLALEYLLTASPEHFRPGRPDAYGVFDFERLEPWAMSTIEWLAKRYGDQLVSATLHIDEATPHIHAVIVPAERKLDRRTNPPAERWGLNALSLPPEYSPEGATENSPP